MIQLLNRFNTKQSELFDIDALKDYIIQEEIDSNLLILAQLQRNENTVKNFLTSLIEKQEETNRLLKKIYNPE